MAEASSQVDGSESKRRKVRKGTQSCWECRRRKVRCIFAATTDANCENCRRRGTACNSQEYFDEPMPSAGSNQVKARLGRVEELIEHLVNRAITAHIPNSPAKDLSEGHLTQLEPSLLAGRTFDRCTGIPVPAPSAVEASVSFGCSGQNLVVCVSRYQAVTAALF
jgi:Fungal Zn(2)-Cys(6) binuclear cluster domain